MAGCGICRHEKRHQIEIGLVHRVPYNVLSRRFGVGTWSLRNHRHKHLSAQVAAGILAAQHPSEIDLEQLQISESEGLLSALVVQRARLQTYAEQASELGDIGKAVAVEGRITANLELVAK